MENETRGLLKVGVIGSGNFGGQIAIRAFEEGFSTIAMNASRRDLDLVAAKSPKIECFLVGDGNGTGKSRDNAKEFLLSHINIVKDDKLTSFIMQNDVIFVAGAAGGGFGSGSVPTLIDIFQQIYANDDKLFIALTTLPDIDETYTAQNHAEQFMREVLALNIPYLVYDNDNFKNLEATKMNDMVDSLIINDLKVLRGDYILPSSSGGIDERDLLTVISQPGRLVPSIFVDFDESTIDDNSIVATMRKHLLTSAHASLVDDKVITASATMYNLGTDSLKYAPAIKHDMQEVFGYHITDYRNEVVSDGSGTEFVAMIAAGLTAPTVRIDKLIARRQQIEKGFTSRESASTKLNTVEAGSLKLNVKSFGGAATSKPATNVDDIIKKFQAGNGTTKNDK